MFEREKQHMVKVQLRGRGIKNRKILEAMSKVPRHQFVEEKLRESAYGDYPLSIGEGQTISQPYMVALMTECLELEGEEKVLEVGTGSGYQSAILAELTREVYSLERVESLSRKAGLVFKELGYDNIKLKIGDGTEGWKEHAPYQGIVITAGSPDIPSPLIDQLAEGGHMVIPVGDRFSQELMIVRKNNGKVERKIACACVFVPLVGKFGWKE